MQHKDLNIWIETDRGAQHWQRAAVAFSVLSGILTGLFAFSILFYTTRLPLAEKGELSIALSKKDAHTRLASEFFGYIEDPSLHHIPATQNPVVISLATSQRIIDSRKFIRLFSLFPQSYLASNGHFSRIRIESYGVQVIHAPLLGAPSASFAPHEFVRLADTPTTFMNNLHLSSWEGSAEVPNAFFAGNGTEDSFISLLSSLKRPVITTPALLSDGTVVQEIRASKQTVGIDTASGITTYASTSPYLLATHNTQTNAFTLRTTPSAPSVSEDDTPTSDPDCPFGTITNFSFTSLRDLGIHNIVTSVVDSVSSTNKSTSLCITVDNL